MEAANTYRWPNCPHHLPQPFTPLPTHLVEAIEVAVDVHGGPGQHQQPRLHLVLQVLQVRVQQRLQHGRHVVVQPLQLLQSQRGRWQGRHGKACDAQACGHV